MPTAYLNGEFLDRDEARISVMDRGFLFADGVYEVIPVFRGKAFRLEEHLDRLDYSLSCIAIDNPLSREEWVAMLQSLISKNESENQAIYLQVTRGAFEHRTHEHKHRQEHTVLAFSNPIGPADETRAKPLKAITCEDIRWKRCDIKSVSLLPNTMMKQQAIDAGADEAILIRDGMLTEGSASNIFVVRNGTIATTPKSHYILGGITRDLVIELVTGKNLPFEERQIPEEELAQCEEIWITSSTKEISPVTELNGKAVGDGKPGPVWEQVIGIYSTYKKEYF